MIEVRNLTFEYPGVVALDNVSFTVPRQSITALVGPNGAGKTTLLRSLADLETPSAGTIVIDGIDSTSGSSGLPIPRPGPPGSIPRTESVESAMNGIGGIDSTSGSSGRDPKAPRRRLGYLSDSFGLYRQLTARRCLAYAALSFGVPEAAIPEAIEDSAKRLDISDLLEKKAGALSRGQRQRLAIAQAIIHNPPVLLLDEPASGLDPEARHALATLFVALRDRGMTLVVSSHILTELSEYSTTMLIIDKGKIVGNTHVSDAYLPDTRVLVGVVEMDGSIRETVLALDGVKDFIQIDSRAFRVTFAGDDESHHRLLAALIGAGIRVTSFVKESLGMNDLYLATISKQGGNGAQR